MAIDQPSFRSRTPELPRIWLSVGCRSSIRSGLNASTFPRSLLLDKSVDECVTAFLRLVAGIVVHWSTSGLVVKDFRGHCFKNVNSFPAIDFEIWATAV